MKNFVNLTGNIGAKPEFFEKDGRNYTRFNLAINNYKKNKDNGEYEKLSTDWISVTAFQNSNNLASRLINLEKGESVQVQGRLKSGVYEKNGEEKHVLNVIANHVVKITPLSKEIIQNFDDNFEGY